MLKNLFLLGILLNIATACLFIPLDKRHYTQRNYYHRTKDSLKVSLNKTHYEDTSQVLSIGWSKINITPSGPLPLAGYAGRKDKYYKTVLDSIFIRAFVIKKGPRSSVIVCSDLLIFPMEVKKSLKSKLSGTEYVIDDIYFTATHSHNSIGGWGKRLIGQAIAGKYNRKVVEDLADAVALAISQAAKNAQPGRLEYIEGATHGLVYNRLNSDDTYLDTLLRGIKFTQINTLKTAMLLTFSAHPTSIPSSQKLLSGDYPSYLCKIAEASLGVDMVGFAAAGVASHSPIQSNADSIPNNLIAYSKKILQTIRKSPVALSSGKSLGVNSTDVLVYLRKPQLRISNNWVLAPWIFNLGFGKYESQIKVLKAGNILLIGVPCDFSGQLSLPLIDYARNKNIHLVITSFNGGYIGYITPDKYYNKRSYETRDMNLFGPYNGAYLSEIIKEIIDYY